MRRSEHERDAEFNAALLAHRAKNGKLSGSEIATASMAKILAEGPRGASIDTASGSGLAKDNMARILRASRAQ